MMWGGCAKGGKGDDRRCSNFGGYESLPALLEDMHKQISEWDHLSNIDIKVWWRHPLARPAKRKEKKPHGHTH